MYPVLLGRVGLAKSSKMPYLIVDARNIAERNRYLTWGIVIVTEHCCLPLNDPDDIYKKYVVIDSLAGLSGASLIYWLAFM